MRFSRTDVVLVVMTTTSSAENIGSHNTMVYQHMTTLLGHATTIKMHMMALEQRIKCRVNTDGI